MKLKRITTSILTLSFCLTLFAGLVISSTAETDKREAVKTENYAAGTSFDYKEYRSHFGEAASDGSVDVLSDNHISGGEKRTDGKYGDVFYLKAFEETVFAAEFPADGIYNLEMIFGNTDEQREKYNFSFKIDGAFPFADCEKLVLRAVWVDDGEIRTLNNGDQVNPVQKHTAGFVSQTVIDQSGVVSTPFEFYLSKGTHTFTVSAVDNDLLLAGFKFNSPEKVKAYKTIADGYANYKNYDGAQIIIEGEKPLYKTAFSLTSKSDQGSSDVSPSNPNNAVLNYIGGNMWNESGELIAWEADIPKDGLYKLGISFKQNFVADGDVYRRLKIDGKTPFKEAGEISFSYDTKWRFKEFGDSEGNDYLFYLTKGKHTLSLEVTLGDISEVYERLEKIVSPLAELYLDMVMITGETPDSNRDYELHKQIPDFENILVTAYENTVALSNDIENGLNANGELNGALKNTARILKAMYENLYNAHLQIQSYYSAQQTLSAWLYDIKNMSLSVDQIVLASPDKEFEKPTANFFEKIEFFLKRYVNSYVSDTNTHISGNDSSLPTIKIWVNWGRDQVKVLNTLIQESFTPSEKVNVSVEQVNATLVQGVISGNSPDLYLHLARTETVNLAMRGVLYNLNNFKDLDSVLSENFMKGAETPYIYQGGCYSLPDTQQFYVMFYRKDILGKLGIKVPKTWDEFLDATGILQRNQMNTYLPYTKLGAATTVNVGAGGLTIFPTMLLQNGGSVYNDEQNATALSSKESVKAFRFWTDFYTQYSLDQDANFYQKFRAGTIPLGIANYTQYLQFAVSAPEITDKWEIAEIPGVAGEDGTVNNICSGAGTGAAVMKSSKNKDAAWRFIKWWVSEDTQYRYSSEVESILGESGRVSSANPNAIKRLNWDSRSLNTILSQWEKVREVPEVPGSYYVSRSIDQAFWSVDNGTLSPKEAIYYWSEVSDKEIARKIKEYSGKVKGAS